MRRGGGGAAPSRHQRPPHATCRGSRAPPRASGRPRAAPPSRYAPPPARPAEGPRSRRRHPLPPALLWRRAGGGAGTSPSTGAGPRERLSRRGGTRGGQPSPVSRVAPATPPPGDGPRERDGSGRWQLLGAGPHPTFPGRRARMRSRGAARSL